MSASTVETRDALASRVEVSENTLTVGLTDGRTIAVPLAWYPRLVHATAAERNSWRLIGGGHGVHWPKIDEDISVANLLSGQPSMETRAPLRNGLPIGRNRAVHRRGGQRIFDFSSSAT